MSARKQELFLLSEIARVAAQINKKKSGRGGDGGGRKRRAASGLRARRKASGKEGREEAIARRNETKERKPEYCTYFNRFGFCGKEQRGVCPYIHDKAKVNVCTSFLVGECPNEAERCLLNHTVPEQAKMPVCKHFLEDGCARDNCAYLHVRVAQDAPICDDFLKGMCTRAERCGQVHTWTCREYERTGECSDGKACVLKHPKKKSQLEDHGLEAREKKQGEDGNRQSIEDEGLLLQWAEEQRGKQEGGSSKRKADDEMVDAQNEVAGDVKRARTERRVADEQAFMLRPRRDVLLRNRRASGSVTSQAVSVDACS